MKHEPMTLREAVEIVSNGRPGLMAESRWKRARAIVDAAVEAHEARVKFDDDYDYGDEVRRSETYKKLRALERGEEAPRG